MNIASEKKNCSQESRVDACDRSDGGHRVWHGECCVDVAARVLQQVNNMCRCTNLALLVFCVHVCSESFEHGHGSMVATTRGAVERCPTIVVLSVDARGVWIVRASRGEIIAACVL